MRFSFSLREKGRVAPPWFLRVAPDEGSGYAHAPFALSVGAGTAKGCFDFAWHERVFVAEIQRNQGFIRVAGPFGIG